jgi:hypothetical protein
MTAPPPPAVAIEDEGSEGGVPGRAKWSKRRAKAYLESCPRRPVVIERTNDDVKYETEQGQPAYQYVGWNGWAYPVPKGRSVDVPEPIAQILEQSRELFRTTQARERRAFFNDIGDGLGVEVSI